MEKEISIHSDSSMDTTKVVLTKRTLRFQLLSLAAPIHHWHWIQENRWALVCYSIYFTNELWKLKGKVLNKEYSWHAKHSSLHKISGREIATLTGTGAVHCSAMITHHFRFKCEKWHCPVSLDPASGWSWGGSDHWLQCSADEWYSGGAMCVLITLLSHKEL